MFKEKPPSRWSRMSGRRTVQGLVHTFYQRAQSKIFNRDHAHVSKFQMMTTGNGFHLKSGFKKIWWPPDIVLVLIMWSQKMVYTSFFLLIKSQTTFPSLYYDNWSAPVLKLVQFGIVSPSFSRNTTALFFWAWMPNIIIFCATNFRHFLFNTKT